MVPSCNRFLPRAPRGADHLVMQRHDSQCPGRTAAEPLGRARKLLVADSAGLVPPGADGIDADDVRARARVNRLRRLPLALELAPRRTEPRGERVRDVVVPGHSEHWEVEPAKEVRCKRMFRTLAAVGQVAARDHEFRLHAISEAGERPLQNGVVPGSEMKVGNVQDACRQGRRRLYSGCDG